MPDILFKEKKIRYAVFGEGNAVLLLHGFGENGRVWKNQIEHLQSHFKNVVPDLPGSGNSEPLQGEPTLDDFADAIEKIMQQESPGNKYSVFGHSMGGYTTMAFVEKYTDQLNSFGLVHSSAFADIDEKKEIRKKGISFIEKNGGAAFLKTVIPNLFSDESKKAHPEFVEDLTSLTKEITDNTLIQYYQAMIKRPDRSSLLRNTKLPVLFIIGKHDSTIPLDISLKQSHLPSISSVNILDHSGHLGMWEEAEATNKAIQTFLTMVVTLK